MKWHMFLLALGILAVTLSCGSPIDPQLPTGKDDDAPGEGDDSGGFVSSQVVSYWD